ncbi:MAG: hypothetical protein ACO3QQ_06735, partial [Candidatus Nanopelagicaceae bacterium]
MTALANASLEEGAEKVFLQSLGRDATAAEIKAAKEARKKIAAMNEEAYMDAKNGGKDLVEEVTSEAGKAMIIALLGANSARARADRELTAAKESTAMSIDRIRIAFKNLSADFINTLAPVIQMVSDKFIQLVNFIKNLSPELKVAITTVIGLAAALGPLVFMFGQLKLGFGVMLEGAMRLVPGIKAVNVQALATNSGLLRLKKGLTMQGDTVVNLNGRFSTLIGTLATGDGAIAKMADRFGRMTGILKDTNTATKDVINSMDEVKRAGERALQGVTAESIDLTGGGGGVTPVSGKIIGNKIPDYSDEVALRTIDEMNRLGFAGVAGQKLDVDLQREMAKQSAVSQSKLLKSISKGMQKAGFDISPEDVAKLQLGPKNRVFDLEKQEWLKDDALSKKFSNVIKYHQRTLKTTLDAERINIEIREQLEVES